jgi:hypothetical protein
VFRSAVSLFLPLVLALLVLADSGCATRRLNKKKNQKLLRRVEILSTEKKPEKSELYAYVKQKPNRRVVIVPLYLQIYNLVNHQRDSLRQIRKEQKYLKKKAKYDANLRRREPQKRRTVGQFLQSIGEAPVVYDSSLTERTHKQFELYLHNKGYFDAQVKDTVLNRRMFLKHKILKKVLAGEPLRPIQKLRYNIGLRKKHKVFLFYYIAPRQPYVIRSVSYDVQDPQLALLVNEDKDSCYLIARKPGEYVNYDVDIFSAERDRITRNLRNKGYYQFTKDYVRFEVDSSSQEHYADVIIRIRSPRQQISDTSWTATDHKRYYVRHITVRTIGSVQELKNDDAPREQITYVDHDSTRTIYFLRDTLREPEFPYKPEVLTSRILIDHNGALYNESEFAATYRQLISLRLFRQVFVNARAVGPDQVDCEIVLVPLMRQSYQLQVEGTNTGGNLGIGGQFAFQNNNLFRGAEMLEFRVRGGTEAQQPITQTQQNGPEQVTLNTIEAGAEISLNIPRAMAPYNLFSFARAEGRRSTFLTSFNYQRRLDYDRTIFNLSYGYNFSMGRFGRMGIYLQEFNVVRVTPKAGLAAFLNTNRDPVLRYRFTDHFINESRVTYTLNTQNPRKSRDVHYLRAEAGLSGNIMRFLFERSQAQTDSNGSYRVFGIPFSQYVRVAATYIYSRRFGDHQQLVIRVAQGVGVPLDNFPAMPLEKSFFAGGANGIRAWEARSLGPGSYPVPANEQFAQFGDVQAEYNIELRFRITNTLKGAIFADGGNIWLLRPDTTRPNGNFEFSRFVNDLAFGPGFGLRYDLSFFIIRLDLAFKMRDPSLPYGERWWVGQRPLGSNLNFGIGYPF